MLLIVMTLLAWVAGVALMALLLWLSVYITLKFKPEFVDCVKCMAVVSLIMKFSYPVINFIVNDMDFTGMDTSIHFSLWLINGIVLWGIVSVFACTRFIQNSEGKTISLRQAFKANVFLVPASPLLSYVAQHILR